MIEGYLKTACTRFSPYRLLFSPSRHRNFAFARHFEIQRIGDKAQAMRFVVQSFGLFDVLRLGDGDLRAQRGFDEPAQPGIVAFVHHGFGVVGVGGYGDARRAAQVQIPEFVAGGDGGQQHVFGVVAVFVAAKGGVGRAVQIGFAGDFDGVIARIGGVGRCAVAQVARPFDSGAVSVLFAHGVFLCGVGCRVVGCFANGLWIAMQAT